MSNHRGASRMLATLFLVVSVYLPSSSCSAGLIEFFDHTAYSAASNNLSVVDFDSLPVRSILTGNEFAGITITARRITVLNPQDFSPGLALGGANINSQPHGISASLFYSGSAIAFDNGNDDFQFSLNTPLTSAGLWLGNLGASNNDPTTATTVSFFDQMGGLLAQESLTQSHVGLIGSGANNRIFYGITSMSPIGSFTVVNAASDGDGIVLDDVQFGSVSAVPEPSSGLLLLAGAIGIIVLNQRQRILNE